jgi:hypothetical protein
MAMPPPVPFWADCCLNPNDIAGEEEVEPASAILDFKGNPRATIESASSTG